MGAACAWSGGRGGSYLVRVGWDVEGRGWGWRAWWSAGVGSTGVLTCGSKKLSGAEQVCKVWLEEGPHKGFLSAGGLLVGRLTTDVQREPLNTQSVGHELHRSWSLCLSSTVDLKATSKTKAVACRHCSYLQHAGMLSCPGVCGPQHKTPATVWLPAWPAASPLPLGTSLGWLHWGPLAAHTRPVQGKEGLEAVAARAAAVAHAAWGRAAAAPIAREGAVVAHAAWRRAAPGVTHA